MSSRKRKSEIAWDKIIILAAGLVTMLLIVFLAVKWSSGASQIKRLTEENESLRWEVSEWESSQAKGQTMAENKTDAEGGTDTSGAAGSKETGETSVPETTIPETTIPETTALPETEPVKLETLDGVAAGTEIDKAKLDMDNLDKYFRSYEIKTTGATYPRINGNSYQENPNVKLSDLRYLKVLHYNYNHQLQAGEIIVNKGLADEVLSIFRELYDAEYEIQSMYLVDNYWTGDGVESDSASIDKNNTSSFNYRPAVGGKNLSNHAYGFAIDINPQQNPYVSYSSGKAKWQHKNANDYIDRDTGLPHVITHEDTAYKIFKAHGFKWGGDWNNPKDYQHFEKKLN